MTFDDWEASCKSKIQGTWNLHELLPEGMDFFLCLASLSGIIGTGGQANYAAGNSYLDEFARYRCSLGQRTVSIDLGWMEAVGVTANHSLQFAAFNRIGGLPAITQLEFLALMDYCCDPRTDLLRQILIGFRITNRIVTSDDGLIAFPWLTKTTFNHLTQAALQDTASDTGGDKRAVVNYTAMFRDAGSIEDAQQAVLLCLKNRLSKALSVEPEDVDLSRPLHACGVDSLLAVEIRNHLAGTFDADIAVFDIMNARSIEAVGAQIVKKSALRAK
nr:reducing polyketide synthase fub1 [Quercus suber]